MTSRNTFNKILRQRDPALFKDFTLVWNAKIQEKQPSLTSQRLLYVTAHPEAFLNQLKLIGKHRFLSVTCVSLPSPDIARTPPMRQRLAIMRQSINNIRKAISLQSSSSSLASRCPETSHNRACRRHCIRPVCTVHQTPGLKNTKKSISFMSCNIKQQTQQP